MKKEPGSKEHLPKKDGTKEKKEKKKKMPASSSPPPERSRSRRRRDEDGSDEEEDPRDKGGRWERLLTSIYESTLREIRNWS